MLHGLFHVFATPPGACLNNMKTNITGLTILCLHCTALYAAICYSDICTCSILVSVACSPKLVHQVLQDARY